MMDLGGIVGQDRAVAELRRDLQSGTVRHAYLFCGQAGIGKRTTAEAFAQSILCRERTEGWRRCGACRDCQLAAHGNHPDLFMIRPEEKKEYSIAQIRQLQTFLDLRTVMGGHRIFLLDDGDRLGPVAGNALLKSIEEPPPRTVFLLTAPSPDAMLGTLVSRCQVVRFTGPGRTGLEVVRPLVGPVPFPDLLQELWADPVRVFSRAEELEKDEDLSGILLGWIASFRDALVAGADPPVPPRSDVRWQEVPSEAVCRAGVDAIQECMEAIGSRGNRRLALDVMLLKLTEAGLAGRGGQDEG